MRQAPKEGAAVLLSLAASLKKVKKGESTCN